MTQFDMNYFTSVIEEMAAMIEIERDYLTSLDSNIGDGDHGINLSIGFRDVSKQLENFDKTSETISSLFKKVGMSLLGKVGGASGPLYGSFFLKMGTAAQNKSEVTFAEFVDMYSAGVTAVQNRGKAELGDKTMIDALLPAMEYLTQHKETEDVVAVMQEALTLMKQGAESTDNIVAKKGRALRLGERAIGHRDPGAESSWKLFECFVKKLGYLKER
ncbi:dihydroxyacetone kinase subunit DhaL [Streptococcus respiraculi]|uniref:dihydroxyacetone kinase subunit DhaL n=1 Tax=Streptococcus respiraculi TaxID=2021971 RepID=UPI000E74B677|nr:dihydroxyacetone kinase subunit DhaL [Streptococcus respiraculi]